MPAEPSQVRTVNQQDVIIEVPALEPGEFVDPEDRSVEDVTDFGNLDPTRIVLVTPPL